MANIHKINAAGGLRIPVLTSDPVSPENGLIWYNSTSNVFKRYENGSTTDLGGSPSFSDAEFEIVDNVDGTKKIVFQASGIATGTSRTITMPDANVDLGDIANKADSSVVTEIDANVDDLISLSGVAENSANLGTFTGATIPDSSTVKAALQALETEVETKADSSHTHVAADVTDFDSAALAAAVQSGAITDAVTKAPTHDAVFDALAGKAAVSHSHAISDVTGLQTALDNKLDDSQLGAANGVASLDANSLIPIGQIPPAALERLVIVADQAARFALTTATVQNGDTVKQTDTGAMYFVKDDANLDSAAGYEIYTAGTASSVAWSGVTGTPTTLAGYGITDDALPGHLDINGKTLHDDTGIRFGSSAADFYVDQYFHALTLTASSTNAVESSLSFAHAAYEGLIVEYKIKEATTNRLRVGVLMITSDGTNTSIVDNCTESADVGVTWNLNINGATTEVRYTTTANNKVMRAVAKKIKA